MSAFDCEICGKGKANHETTCAEKTLRDEFAMSALMGIVGFQTSFGQHPQRLELRSWVSDAYRCADAMLEARKKESKGGQ